MSRNIQSALRPHFHDFLKRSRAWLIAALMLALCLPVMSAWAQTEEPTEDPVPEPTVEVTLIATEEPTEEPTAEPTSEETVESTPEETPESTPEETTEVTPEITVEPTAEETSDVTAEPTAAPTLAPTPVATTAPVEVEVEAPDGQILRGSYYAVAASELPDTGAPAVLLMHMNNSNRDAWRPVIQPLVDAGYNVLTVDLRGFGRTGGSRDWELARTDVLTWLEWLRTQPEVDAAFVSTMGASIGSNLAVVGCGDDPDCVTAIALSPGLDYFGVKPAEALETTLENRSALIVTAHNDRQSVSGVGGMLEAAEGEVGLRIFTGASHGTNLFLTYGDRLIPLIIDWLDEHNAAKLKTITGS